MEILQGIYFIEILTPPLGLNIFQRKLLCHIIQSFNVNIFKLYSVFRDLSRFLAVQLRYLNSLNLASVVNRLFCSFSKISIIFHLFHFFSKIVCSIKLFVNLKNNLVFSKVCRKNACSVQKQ